MLWPCLRTGLNDQTLKDVTFAYGERKEMQINDPSFKDNTIKRNIFFFNFLTHRPSAVRDLRFVRSWKYIASFEWSLSESSLIGFLLYENGLLDLSHHFGCVPVAKTWYTFGWAQNCILNKSLTTRCSIFQSKRLFELSQ